MTLMEVLMEDQGHPAPTIRRPHTRTAPLACTVTTLEPDGELGGCRAGGWLSALGE